MNGNPGVGWSFSGAELPWIHPWGLVLSVHAALGDRGPRWPGRIAAARTRMEPRMYRMVVPMPLMEWGQKASPLGKLAFAKQMTEEVPFGWLRAFIVAEARGAACGDLFRPAAQRSKSFRARATFPKGQCHQLKESACYCAPQYSP